MGDGIFLYLCLLTFVMLFFVGNLKSDVSDMQKVIEKLAEQNLKMAKSQADLARTSKGAVEALSSRISVFEGKVLWKKNTS